MNVKEVRYFLGTYSHRFISKFSGIASPIFDLTKKGLDLNDHSITMQMASKFLKDHLATLPLLSHAYLNKPCTLYTGASNLAIGACLVQTKLMFTAS